MIKKRFLITASNTDSGKTFLTLKILTELAQRGLRVGAIKPIETGVDTLPVDGKKLYDLCRELNPGFHSITLDDVVPVRYSLPAAPYVSKNGNAIDYDAIDAEVLFFTTDKLGMISESIVNLAYLKERKLACHWGINLMGSRETFDRINRPFLEKHFKKITLLPEEMEQFVTDILA